MSKLLQKKELVQACQGGWHVPGMTHPKESLGLQGDPGFATPFPCSPEAVSAPWQKGVFHASTEERSVGNTYWWPRAGQPSRFPPWRGKVPLTPSWTPIFTSPKPSLLTQVLPGPFPLWDLFPYITISRITTHTSVRLESLYPQRAHIHKKLISTKSTSEITFQL